MRRDRLIIEIIDSFEANPWYDLERDRFIHRKLLDEVVYNIWARNLLEMAKEQHD